MSQYWSELRRAVTNDNKWIYKFSERHKTKFSKNAIPRFQNLTMWAELKPISSNDSRKKLFSLVMHIILQIQTVDPANELDTNGQRTSYQCN